MMPTLLKTSPIGILVRDNLGKTISILLNFYAFIIQCNLIVDYKLNLVRLNNYVARYLPYMVQDQVYHMIRRL